MDWQPLLLTLQLALITTIIFLIIGIPLASWLAFSRSKLKYVIEPMISLPLVLPPTVIGFYLLLLFSPKYFLGHYLETTWGIRVAFSFPGLIIGSVLFSLPFMVNPIKAALQNFPSALMESSYSLGKSFYQTLWRVVLPNVKAGVLTGIVMAFAHTIGEFGVVLMIGGNIPGETRVASIAIFSEVEALNYDTAHVYSAVLVVLSFVILCAFYWFNRKPVKLL